MSNNRRTANSPMRMASPATRPATKAAPAKVMAKTGTDDNEWEEF